MCFFNKNGKICKALSKEFESINNFRKTSRNYFVQNVDNGEISVEFENMIEITFHFKGELPDKYHDKIFNLGMKNETKIHNKIVCGAIDYEFISFVFFSKHFKDLTINDILSASKNILHFVNENILDKIVPETIDY